LTARIHKAALIRTVYVMSAPIAAPFGPPMDGEIIRVAVQTEVDIDNPVCFFLEIE
jgi:hypothetical protein